MESRLKTLAYLLGMAAGSAIMFELIINAQPAPLSSHPRSRAPKSKPYTKTGDKLLVMRAASK